jgi:hypothetical protein
VISHVSAGGPSNALPAPLDLILVVSVPPTHAAPTLALSFLLAQVDARDRVALVTFEMGAGGAVRKTKFITPARTQSRAQLGKAVGEIDYQPEDSAGFKDNFAVLVQEEKRDAATAIKNDGSYAVARVAASANRECPV